MNADLLKAILAMDSYNRGYNPGIDFGPGSETIGTIQLGTATIYDTSTVALGDATQKTAGFYAVAYQLADTSVVISYRGTDQFFGDGGIGGDIPYGYYIGGGLASNPLESGESQGDLALDFYNDVAAALGSSNISFTGHSEGGGLAGFVAGIENKQATVFESMAYDGAAFAYSSAANTSLVTAFDIQGQALDYAPTLVELSVGLAALSPITEPIADVLLSFPNWAAATPTMGDSLDLGADVTLTSGYVYPADFIFDALDRHDAALMVLRMYAQETTSVGSDWKSAAKYFLPELYDNAFAEKTGIYEFGRYITSSNVLSPDHPYDTVLREVIAYSAIDEGGTYVAGANAARPFGDTGIIALYDDADDLGRLLPFSNASQYLINHAVDISKSFVEFAGDLAYHHVLQAGTYSGWSGGILTSDSTDHTLTIAFDADRWEMATGTLPAMAGRNDLLTGILFDSDLAGTAVAPSVVATMEKLWDDDTKFSSVESVVFTTTNDDEASTVASTPSDGKVLVFVGGEGNDDVLTTTGNDLILTGDGDDTITANDGNDVIISGAGADIVNAGIGDDIVYGHDSLGISGHYVLDGDVYSGGVATPTSDDGTDTINYSAMSNGVQVVMQNEEQGNAITWIDGST